jgi:glycosyltransferase involved in cell wall biosynthesis
MRYPIVLFFRYNKYAPIDDYLKVNKDKIMATIHIVDNKEELNKLFSPNYHLLITFGEGDHEYYKDVISVIPDRVRHRWIHYKEMPDLTVLNNSLSYCLVNNSISPREKTRPIFSVFTTCFNSFEKIVRAYSSLKVQTLKDWEWIILDDSPDDKHFEFLRQQFTNDYRVRFYRKSANSGSIGDVKNEAVSLCRGKYVLEFDHDDEILPSVLETSSNVFEQDPDVGFIYMDFTNIYENGKNFNYGDGLVCRGYSGYYCQKYKGTWIYVFMTANVNNVTLSHLTCCPNHPRIWKRQVLLDIGNYSEFLPICDDYEILLRTAVNTKIVRIHELGYVQYMNEGNNNFSLIRNGEINRIGPAYISPQFYEMYNVKQAMKDMNAFEDEKYNYAHCKVWERTNYEYKYCNKVVNVKYNFQYCIMGLSMLTKHIDFIREQTKISSNDFIILDNTINNDALFNYLDTNGLDSFKCYSLIGNSAQEMLNYFNLMYKSCNNCLIIDENYLSGLSEPSVSYPVATVATVKQIKQVPYNTSFGCRHEIINAKTVFIDNYLEIGVEYGQTFFNVIASNYVGVDPDPKCSSPFIKIMTSDEFFALDNKSFSLDNKSFSLDNKSLNTKCKYDCIFIDGMHQVEYILKDINNCINILATNGNLFIDDILPLTHGEQLKIPNKHYYENGILKYGEPWTGDVWKVFYYILKNHRGNIEFEYFNHQNYRGVAMLTILSPFKIKDDDETLSEINSYDYYKDFNDYTTLLTSANV